MGVKVVKEIVQGASGVLSLDAQSGGGGGGGLRYQRCWKIVFENPSDIMSVDVRDHIGTTIGQVHPTTPFCACDNIDVKPDGDSRLAYIVTASYSTTALSLQTGGTNDQNQDPRTQAPDARKANWSTDITTIEMPSWWWKPIWPAQAPGVNAWGLAKNPAGDLYDGVMTLQPLMTLKIEQTQSNDPNIWGQYVGGINTTTVRVGNTVCLPHSLMLKGISATPHAEIVGRVRWRGWKANYEFVYKPGYNNYLQQYIGWDVATPVSGWNVKNLNGATARADVDKGALALKLTNDTVGSIQGWKNNAVLEPTLVGEKSRANVLISAPGSKATQRPSSQPVALNWDGTPRNTDLNGGLQPLVQINQVYQDFEMNNMRLRVD